MPQLSLRWIIGIAAALLIAAPNALFATPEETILTDAEAQETVAQTATAPDAGRADPAMWVVRDDDSEIWLLGTFHILPPGLDWRSDALARAIDAADKIYFEAEVDTPDAQQKTIQTLMTQGFLPKGASLSAMLGDDDATMLQQVSAEVGLPFEAVDTMRPWQAFLNLTVQYIVSQGFDPSSGVETVLLSEARVRGRDLGFFETVSEQLALFTSLDPEVELELLRLTLRDWDKQDEQFAELFRAWREGDVDAIDRLMNDTMRVDAPEVYDALLIQRNAAWGESIERLMAGRGRILVAVGAGHLVGDKSVPAILAEKGFDVSRYGLDD
ncbi:MAG: TraB/GumN family protein [Pseudomonadota bacterium]